MGCIAPNGHTLFHCCLRYNDEQGAWIFDASVGEWAAIDAVRAEQEAFGTALPPPQWAVTLPDHWLKSAADVELAWRMQGTPALGQARRRCPRSGRVLSLPLLFFGLFVGRLLSSVLLRQRL